MHVSQCDCGRLEPAWTHLSDAAACARTAACQQAADTVVSAAQCEGQKNTIICFSVSSKSPPTCCKGSSALCTNTERRSNRPSEHGNKLLVCFNSSSVVFKQPVGGSRTSVTLRLHTATSWPAPWTWFYSPLLGWQVLLMKSSIMQPMMKSEPMAMAASREPGLDSWM